MLLKLNHLTTPSDFLRMVLYFTILPEFTSLKHSPQTKEDDRDPEGWEYSKLFTTRFHSTEKTFDMVRRRRWNRKLVCDIPAPITFTVYEVGATSMPLPITLLYTNFEKYYKVLMKFIYWRILLTLYKVPITIGPRRQRQR